uniref:Uncharacterized protein n=1 Tax=Anguilla anguilla TaxID=7936 RepID=A0A0E9TP11_ANGAN
MFTLYCFQLSCGSSMDVTSEFSVAVPYFCN